jgi:hypothetical protein
MQDHKEMVESEKPTLCRPAGFGFRVWFDNKELALVSVTRSHHLSRLVCPTHEDQRWPRVAAP